MALIPECLDDFIADDNPVRIIDAFADELNLGLLGFENAAPAPTGRPSYRPAALLKIYLYSYLNKVQSGRRLERDCQRNVELMWPVGRLAPDFKTITFQEVSVGRSPTPGAYIASARFGKYMQHTI